MTTSIFSLLCSIAPTILMWVFHRQITTNQEKIIFDLECKVKILEGAIDYYRAKHNKKIKDAIDGFNECKGCD